MTAPPISEGLVRLHAELDGAEIIRLRALTVQQRGALIVSACEAAAMIARSRRVSGLPDATPAPWPASTWAFLKEHAARARS
jgi:hypothetical protein